jgi:hypothetical protein
MLSSVTEPHNFHTTSAPALGNKNDTAPAPSPGAVSIYIKRTKDSKLKLKLVCREIFNFCGSDSSTLMLPVTFCLAVKGENL